MDTVLVSMRRSYIYQGKHYGPGSAVRVPVALQASLNLPIVVEAKAKTKTEPKDDAK